ncbi:glycosyl hydrolase family 61-domain-containing protein [Auriculariales sp. MPI-PUGE-AT-0066]|nr:glycosyl hydrolase family 61-domain-containing protein [Auriculariales sp. MPI-PUGE-AT-0066]
MSSARASLLVAFLAASFSLVRSHGSVDYFEANGQSWGAPYPGAGSDWDSPVRVISTLEPTTDMYGPAIKCGPGAGAPAKVVAEVTAGSDVLFGWRSGEEAIPWVHQLGPVMLFAYKCPGDAKDCQPADDDKGWALIDAAGFDERSGFQSWVQSRFNTREKVPAKIPAGLPSGDYLLRHEIVALHVATSRGPEFYTSCTQVRVTGGASANLSLADAGAEVVSFPGGYTKDMPGLFANVFGEANKDNYKFPGPALFTPSAVPSTPSTPEPQQSPSPSNPPPSSPEPSAPPPKSCKKRRSSKRAKQQHNARRQTARRAL